ELSRSTPGSDDPGPAEMRWVALVSLTVAMGCGTSPSAQFFTLDALRPAGPPPTTAGAPLKVVAVHVPSVLDRQEIVEEGAAGTLSVSDEHRWGAPFGDMVRRVLTQDLAARLPKDMVLFPDQPAPPGANDLVVDILEFERDASGAVVFDGSWSLVQGSSDSTLLA